MQFVMLILQNRLLRLIPYKALIAVGGTRTGSPLTGWVLQLILSISLRTGQRKFLQPMRLACLFGSLSTRFSGTNYWTGLTTT